MRTSVLVATTRLKVLVRIETRVKAPAPPPRDSR